MKENSVAKN